MPKSNTSQDANDLNVDQMNISNDSGTRNDQSVTNVTNHVRGDGNTTTTLYDASRHNTTNVHYGDNNNTSTHNYGPINNYNAPVNNNYGAGSRFYSTNAYHNSTVNNGDYYAPNAHPPVPPMSHRSQTTVSAAPSGPLRAAESRSARQGSQNSHGPGTSTPGHGQQRPPVTVTGQTSSVGQSSKTTFNPWAKYYPKPENSAQGKGSAEQNASATLVGSIQVPVEDDDDSDFVDTDSSVSGGEPATEAYQRRAPSLSTKSRNTSVTTHQVIMSWSSRRDEQPSAKDGYEIETDVPGVSGSSSEGQGGQ